MADTIDIEAEDTNASSSRLPFSFVRRYGVLLTDEQELQNGSVPIYYKQKPELRTIAELRRFVDRPIKLVPVDELEFNELLAKAYEHDSSQTLQIVQDLDEVSDFSSIADAIAPTEDLLDQEDDAPVIRLINALLAEAIQKNASDVHIETFPNSVVFRFRIDGVLREIERLGRRVAPMLVSRIKVMARLDIAEKRIPQDGRTSLRIGGRELDVRVSVMPTAEGERVVLRLLDKQASHLQLSNLGMNDADVESIRQLIRAPHGILLVTGPTGQGKTTTLYASLSELNTERVNILTVEDPIEYNLDGIGQTQVSNKTGMTFAKGLRAILRQDPDIVMVGEVRDLETAQIAIQASLTGHLVMSTLHTNTAVGTVVRMVDMGLEPYLLASSLLGVLSQRLVRVLCPHCKEEHEPNSFEKDFLGGVNSNIYRPVGCSHCAYTGYQNRTGIYELLILDDQLRQMVHDNVAETELNRYARTKFPSLRDDGRKKVLQGITSVQEVLRVTYDS